MSNQNVAVQQGAPEARRKRVWLIALCAAAIGMCGRRAAADDESLEGVVVYPKAAEVEARVNDDPVKVESLLLFPTRVRRVEGELLWVATRSGEACIKRSDVVTLIEAVGYFTAQLEKERNDQHALLCRGFAYRELGKRDEALADYTRLIRIAPKNPNGFQSRATLRLERRDLDGAIEDFNRAIKLAPRNGLSRMGRGTALFLKQQYVPAVVDFDHAVARMPSYPAAYLNRGLARSRLGDFDLARTDFDLAITLDPELPGPYNARAWLFATCIDASLRDGAQAVKDATRACELAGWQDANLLSTLAAAYAEAGDFEAARERQVQAMQLRPNDAAFLRMCDERLELFGISLPVREVPAAKR
jgi:tetratricopeptide (TPR) repeat protein